MKINFNKLLVLLFLTVFVNKQSFGQVPTVTNYTACPCQTVVASVTWNNASNASYSLYAPPVVPGGPPLATFITNTFSIFNCSQVGANFIYTIVAAGVQGGNPVTNTVTFTLQIVPPQPLNLTNQINYCNGSTAVITAPIGGNTYSFFTPCANGTSNSNVINLPNVTTLCNGNMTVTSVINGCTVTGVSSLNVEPLLTMAISPPANICDGSCTTLTSSLPGGTNYQWYDNFNTALPNAATPNYTKPSPLGAPSCSYSINDAGVYKVTAIHDWPGPGGISCPYSATTQVNVVQTNPVTLAASPSATVCQGKNLNLSATAGNATSFSWAGPGFTSPIANPVITSALPTNTGCYTATATFQGAFLACTTTAAICVSVVPVFVPVITMPPSVCEDYSIAISATAGSNPVSVNWSGPLFVGMGNVAVTATSVPHVPTNASGTQFVTFKFGAGGMCSSTSSIQLNVVPVNTVSVVAPGQVCTPDDAFLQALATGANQYSWVGPGYTNSGPNVWVTHPTPAASGIYTVTAYFGVGTSLVCSNTNTLSLTVNPTLPFSLIPYQRVCYNTPVTISGPAGATSYTWTSSTGFTSNSKDISFASANPNMTGNYTLQVSLGPCKTSDDSELSVLTPLAFTLTPFDRTICRGDTLFLEGGAAGGSENYAFIWNPSIYLESNTGPKQMGIPLGSVGYNLMVYDIACPNYTIGHAFSVNVKQPPSPKLQLSSGAGCAPLTMLYDSKTEAESFVTNYDFGNGKVIQGDSLYVTLDAGTYNLKVYSVGKNGCSGTYEYPYPIVVSPKPGTDIHWEPEVPTTNDELTFYPTHKNGPIVYYSWNFLGGVTASDTSMHNMPGVSDTTNIKNPTRAYNQIGIYPVALISTNDLGCSDTIYKFVKIIDELQIYVPNSFTPNDDGINDVFAAKGTGMKVENFTMDIFNRAGVNVFTTKDITQGWNGKVGGQIVRDNTYIYRIRAVGMNGEGRKEITGYVTIIK